MIDDLQSRIDNNVAHVRDRIARAAERSGRSPDTISLVAVTKYGDVAAARALAAAGCTVLGESRPQELCRKAVALMDKPVSWHLIGHLQRNKVTRTLPVVEAIHSVDSDRLIEAIAHAPYVPHRISILIEVNISRDVRKHGIEPDDLLPLIERVPDHPNICLRGLMAMAGLRQGSGETHAGFARLRKLRDTVRPQCPSWVSLDDLSMGMSADFETAIEEGATIVRIGSLLFDGVTRVDLHDLSLRSNSI
jgi:PLP dependent protein